MLFGWKGKHAFALKVKPKNYGNLNGKLPKEIPKPNKGCGIHTDMCQGLILSWIVDSEQAMDYDDIEATIALTRRYLTEDSGIVECKNGVTAKGYKYVYNIQKMRRFEEGMPVPEVSYTLNFNVNIADTDYFINGNYVEVGTTGIRDSLGFAIFQSAVKQQYPDKELSSEDIMQLYFRDPYDENYKTGFLMNASEKAVLDEKFPNHPLSMLRKYVHWVIENN